MSHRFGSFWFLVLFSFVYVVPFFSSPYRYASSTDIDTSISTYNYTSSSSPSSIDIDIGNMLMCDPYGTSFYYNETIDLYNRIRIIQTKSCPNHYSVCQEAKCGGIKSTRAVIKLVTYEIPLYPMYSTILNDTTCSSDVLGIALNGVPIRGVSDSETPSTCGTPLQYPYINQSSGRSTCALLGQRDGTKYCGDIVRKHAFSLDKCGGRADDFTGHYAYRVPPVCLLQQSTVRRVQYASSHTIKLDNSPQIGWSLDGFPVFGPLGPKRTVMKRCGLPGAHTVLCLDVCNGYYGMLTGYDVYVYRYYITGETGSGECSSTVSMDSTVSSTVSTNSTVSSACERVGGDACCLSAVPSTQFFPYSIGCFRGCLFNDLTCKHTGERGTTQTFLPVSTPAYLLPSTVHLPTPVQYAEPEVQVQSSSTAASIASSDVSASQAVAKQAYSKLVSDSSSYVVSALNRSYAVRVPSSRNIAVISRTSSSISTDGTNGNTAKMTELLTSQDDSFITGMAISPSNDILYFASTNGIRKLNTTSKVSEVLVPELVLLVIEGYNFGSSVLEIKHILIQNSLPCTSIAHINASFITCYCLTAQTALTAEDVTLALTGGSTQGVYADPMIALMSRSGRPIVSSISITYMPVTPYAIAVQAQVTQSTAYSKQYLDVLYWSNIAYGAYCIQRVLSDGSHVQTVVSNVQRVRGIAVASTEYLTAYRAVHVSEYSVEDVVFYVDAMSNTLCRVLLPALHGDTMYDSRYASSTAATAAVVVLSNLESPTGVAMDIAEGEGYLYITAVNGVLLRLDLASALLTDVTVSLPDVLSTVSMGCSWITLIRIEQSISRFTGLAVVPASISISEAWKEPRVLVVDTNQQFIWVSSHTGDIFHSLDVGSSFGDSSIAWPSAVQVSTDIEIDTVTTDFRVCYISEYLGRIWRVKVPIAFASSTSGMPAPELLLDESGYLVSRTLRDMMNAAKASGEPAYKGIFFEILE